jgi:hypothetical protein
MRACPSKWAGRLPPASPAHGAERDAHIVGDGIVPLCHVPLDLDRTVDCFNDAGKFRQDAVAHQLDDAAVMASDGGLQHFRTMALRFCQRHTLVDGHHAAVAGNIGCQDGIQSVFHGGTFGSAAGNMTPMAVCHHG